VEEWNPDIWKTLALLPAGILMVFGCNLAGSLFDFLFRDESGKNTYPIARLFMGYLLLATVFSIYFFQGKTIFSVIGLLISALLIWNRRQVKVDFNIPFATIQVLAFCLLFGFRFFSVGDLERGIFGYFFKDDYFYTCNIASLYYSGREQVFYETLNQAFGFQSFYSIYHYFSFSGALLLKSFTGVNSYFLFHFFTVPFFQFFGLMGLFSITLFYRLNPWKGLILSVMVLSTLRYNPFDDLLVEWINNRSLSRNLIFKNFYGIQFLNSGFGLKFSIALGLSSLVYLYLDRKKVAVFSLFFIFINPLLIFISGSVLVDVLLFRRKNLLAYLIWSIIFLGLFVGFSQWVQTRPGMLNLDEVVANVLRYLNMGPIHFVFFSIGEVMNQYYNLFLLPLILILILRKNWAERSFSILFLTYPILNSFWVDSLLYKGFIVALVFSFLFLLFRNRQKERLFFLVFIFGATVFFSRFSLVFPELNQAFMFITFIFPLLIALQLYCQLPLQQPLFWVGFSAFALVNLGLNYKENRVRVTYPSHDPAYFQKIKKWTQSLNPYGIFPVGVFDSKMTLQFLNQFLTGEEIAQLDDRFLPTPVSVPTLRAQNQENSKGIRQLIPICNFVESHSTTDSTGDFLQKFGIKLVVVKDYDLNRFRPYARLFSDSLVSDSQGYRIYYRQ
jgi:hypothetical protein